jgi:DUF4097 and DUF4098 domain-containing protein YvlB
MRIIPLTKGKLAIVDDNDYDWAMQWKWQVSSEGYAVRSAHDIKYGKKVRMHRALVNAPDGFEVDHINGNRLDNRRQNLRICTHKDNQRNMSKKRGASSIYKGVHWNSRDKRWIVKIKTNEKQVCVGRYKLEVEAAIAYNNAAKKIYGEFARLNQVGCGG